MSRIIIHNNESKKEYVFSEGDNLLTFLREKGYAVSAPCGGNGLCGKCRVTMRIGDVTNTVSACRILLIEDCEVWISDETGDIFWNGIKGDVVTDNKASGYGIAVDIGTTTVAVNLYDLKSGKLLGSKSGWNVQKGYGADVISRIGYCMDNENGLKKLSSDIRRQLVEMIKKLCEAAEIDVSQITTGYVAGNTVMEHIFAEIPPDSIGVAPYLPETCFNDGEQVTVFNIPFYISPCVAGFVGGDITAGVLASELSESDKTALFIDVGTNGEIVLGNENGLVSCAVASGPAFEGAGISCGMRAEKGAIKKVELVDGEISYEVIGGVEPTGICGSGLLDLIACLLEKELVDESGYLDEIFYLTDKVFITQRDIRQLQLAKAAVLAGITRLTETEKLSFEDIDVLYLSGGMGTGMNVESAVRIGMLPKELIKKAVPLGNTSLKGAAMALFSDENRQKLIEISKKCRYIELSADKEFNDCFVEAMGFPEKEEQK